MTITTIYQIFFSWDEYDDLIEFESMHKNYRRIKEDTTGITYEYRSDYTIK